MNLEIVIGQNEENPLSSGGHPIFVVDLWEHAYDVDYGSSRAEYIDNIWQVVNWSFIEVELLKAERGDSSLQNSGETQRTLPLYFRQKWIGVSPSFVKRRKTSIRQGAIYGAIVGTVFFIFFSSLVSTEIILLPGLVSSASQASTALILAVGIGMGGLLGAACGALVGIGTPLPLNHIHH